MTENFESLDCSILERDLHKTKEIRGGHKGADSDTQIRQGKLLGYHELCTTWEAIVFLFIIFFLRTAASRSSQNLGQLR